MKFAAFALLLVVAGAYATPLSDAEVTQGRIYDLVVKDTIERAIAWILERGLDPLNIEEREFNIVIIERQAEASGVIKNLKVRGASSIVIKELKYNFVLGRLDFNVVLERLSVSLGHADVNLIYGDRRGSGVASGWLDIRDIGVKGHVLLKHDSTGRPWIYNINTELDVGGIEANWKIVGSHKDYSETVNQFLNVRLLELFWQYKSEINTVLGELIKFVVEYLRGRN